MTDRFSGPSAGLIVALGCLVILLNLAILGLSIWALAFGVIDVANVGWNGWAIFWIILGGLGVLSSLFGGKASVNR